MSESGNTQLSSLGWVKEEINKSLEGARTALETNVESEDPSDTAGLERCHELIKQVRGTLQMVQLQGALLLTEEMIHLLDFLLADSEKIVDRDQAYEALMRAILQLPDYFSKVQSGQTDAAIILLPLINDLRAGYGESAVVAQALFAPNFNGILPPEMPDVSAFDGGDLSVFIKGIRHQIHLSMLGLFRGKEQEQSLNRLIELYLQCCVTARSEPIKQLYWIAAALCEGIRDGGLDVDALPVKPLLGQIDRQSKMIIDGGEEKLAADSPTELIRILLYYVASSSTQGELIAELNAAFQLDKYLPNEEELEKLRAKLAGPSAEVIEAVIQGIAQELDRARDMLDIYNRTGEEDKERLQQVVQSMRNAAGTIAMVGDTELQASMNEYCDDLDALIEGNKTAEEAGMPGLPDFILQVDAGVQALRPESADRSAAKAASSLTGSTGVWNIRLAVVKESAANMSTAKDVVAAFVKSPDTEREQLEIVSGLLQQIAGSLKVAQLDRASNIIYSLRSFIDKELMQTSKELSASELESLAEAISSADYYLEAVIDELPNKETALDMAEAALDLLGYATGSIDEEIEELADVEPEEDAIEIDEDSSQLDSIAKDLQEEYGEDGEQGDDNDSSFELDAEEIARAEEEVEALEDVPLEEAVSEVDEADADVEEIEIAPPEESEEEMSMRLAAEAEAVDLGDLPSIDTVEETPQEVEEVSVDAPVESEEELQERVQGAIEEAEDPLLKTGEIDLIEEAEIEAVSLEGAEAEEADEITTEDSESIIQTSLIGESPLGEDLDEEIVEIFLEEAEEVLEALRTHFPLWCEDADNSESLTVVRRSFHTLKGSGRMVGAIQIGEFSWSIENLLNKVIDSSIKATPEVLNTISQAIEVLPAMVGQLRGEAGPDADINEMSGVADALAAGKSIADGSVPDEDADQTSKSQKKIRSLTSSGDEASSHSGMFGDSSVSVPLDSEELRQVYTEETNMHLDGLQAFIERCRADDKACFFRDAEILIFHTLHGGSATVGAEALKLIFDILEPVAILLNEHETRVDEPLLKLCEQTMVQVRQFLDEINGSDDLFVPDPELLEELQQYLQQKKDLLGATTGSISILKVMSDQPAEDDDQIDEVPSIDEEGALDEISSSLEDLHDLMSSDAEPESLTSEAIADNEFELDESLVELSEADDYEPESLTAEAMAGDDVELDESLVEPGEADDYEPESLTAEAMADDEVALEESSAADTGLLEDVELSATESAEAPVDETDEVDVPTTGEEEVDPEILDIFLEEAAELLVSIEQTLDEWQNDRDDRNLMISVQRDIHTLKGGARMVNQSALANVSHAMETLLTAVVEDKLEVSDAMYATLHAARDTLQDCYEDLRQGNYNAPTDTDLVTRLESLLHPDGLPEQAAGTSEGDGFDEVSGGFDLLGIFMEEAGELLESIDQTLDDWQQDENNRELAIQVQRDIHTLKGGARMVNLKGIGNLGHALETLLTAIVDGHIEVSRPLFDGLHEVKDELLVMYEKARKGDGDSDVSDEILGVLKSLHYDEVSGSYDKIDVGEEVTPSHMLPALDEDSIPVTLEDSGSFEVTPSEAMSALEDSGNFEVTPSGATSALEDSGRFEETPSGATSALEDVSVPVVLEEFDDSGSYAVSASGSMTALGDEDSSLTSIVEKAENKEKKTASSKDKRTQARVEHETVRVRSDLLDGLVNLAGETNIFRSRLEQQSNSFRFSLSELDQTVIRLQGQLKKLDMETEAQILFRHEKELDDPDNENFDPLEMDRYSTLQQLSRSLVESVGDLNSLQDMLGGLTRDSELLLLQQGRVNSELQDRLMQARVVPFAATMASRLRRITRQTCQQLGKQAELKIIGANEEMDRHVLDRMVAPLEHMLRNSIAHGIEDPDVRQRRNKPEIGTVTVSVSREGGEIVIQVADDGGGLDTAVIRKKAEEKELIISNADMTDEEVMQLILAPGFSTADSVSQIAGRGVGMDVVNNEIRQLNGSLHIESVFERGAAMTVRLPFSLSITQALLVGVAGDLYAIPLTSIEGVSRIDKEKAEQLIEDKDSRYEYGGDEYQLSSLGTLLGRQQAAGEPDEGRPALILVRAGGHRVGFYVDELMGHHEIVVKSLGVQVSSIVGMAGGSIMGDGRVALILDVPALVRMVSAEHEYTVEETSQVQAAVAEEKEDAKLTIMVVDDSITVRRVTTRLLERHDMEVITAKDGVEAVATLEDTIPDVMLLDVEMPRMDGYELATHMRNDSRYKNIPIIMITSRTGDKHRDRAMAIGVDRYLGKPYQEMDLLDNINNVLEERRSS